MTWNLSMEQVSPLPYPVSSHLLVQAAWVPILERLRTHREASWGWDPSLSTNVTRVSQVLPSRNQKEILQYILCVRPHSF
jgi:hypothetical protein